MPSTSTRLSPNLGKRKDPTGISPWQFLVGGTDAVSIYLLVGFNRDGNHGPAGMKVHQYLGLKKEVAGGEQHFIVIGAILLLVSGWSSTMSALNATTFFLFARFLCHGRDSQPAGSFCSHPSSTAHTFGRYFSPAVDAAGGLVVAHREQVAAVADIMFLLLFFAGESGCTVLRSGGLT